MSVQIGPHEFRDKLAIYLKSSVLIEVTRHGQTIGFYAPVPKRLGPGERDVLIEAGRRMRGELARPGLTEEELVADFRGWREVRGTNQAAGTAQRDGPCLGCRR